MEVTLGGDRLGSGNKQTINARTYNRSTHELDFVWRSSMANGTLTPFLVLPALRGDSFDIDLNYDGKTLPTNGPLFGSYKVQLDLFQAPIRLYQGQLHMNKTKIGMKMEQIKLPQIQMKALSPTLEELTGETALKDNFQINPSSIFSYLNIRGLGLSTLPGTTVERQFCAVPYLAYWEIYKDYYANKMEEIGCVIHNPMNTQGDTPITNVTFVDDNGVGQNIFNNPTSLDLALGNNELYVYFGEDISTKPDPTKIILQINTIVVYAHEAFSNWEWQEAEKRYRYYTFNSTYLGIDQLWVCYSQDVPYEEPQFTNPLITTFPLENIDTMREDILTDVKNLNAFIIDENSIAPYGLALKKGDSGLNAYSKLSALEGLGLKTYQSDLFNNWVNTEWIDGVDGISAVTAVDTSSGNFTIDQLNIAQKVYNMLNRIAVSGGTYNDWLNAVYEDNKTRAIETPMYLGGLSKEIVFQEVISNAQTDVDDEKKPLGTLAGRGVMTSKHKGGSVKVRIDEPSFIIGIVSITPRIDYSAGNDWYNNLKTMNDFHKPALDAIGFQDLITDQMHWADTDLSNANNPQFKSAGKQPAWINYMTNVNQIRGNFAIENDSMFMVLNRRYEVDLQGIKDLTTYIDPSKYNHVFADTRTDAQNFWSQIGIRIESRRLMSAKLIPNL